MVIKTPCAVSAGQNGAAIAMTAAVSTNGLSACISGPDVHRNRIDVRQKISTFLFAMSIVQNGTDM